jgi:outer membrane protein OmpA-like peptidoglycan-associated protein
VLSKKILRSIPTKGFAGTVQNLAIKKLGKNEFDTILLSKTNFMKALKLLTLFLALQLEVKAQIVCNDDFNSTASSYEYWHLSSPSQSSIENGKLKVSYRSLNQSHFIWSKQNFYLNVNIDHEIEASFQVSGNHEGHFGLSFGIKDNLNNFNFIVSKSHFYIGEFKAGKWNTLVNYTPLQNPNYQSITLKVEKRNGKYIFYIDGKQVEKKELAPEAGDLFGFIFSNNYLDLEIDYLKVSGGKDKINFSEKPMFEGNFEFLDANVNSADDDVSPVISPDGKTLYFARFNSAGNVGGKEDREDIYVSYLNDKSWSLAQNLGAPLNNSGPNAINSVSPDGNSVLLINKYGDDGKMYGGVSQSSKTSTGWGKPQNLEFEKFTNTASSVYYFLSNDRKILFLSICGEGCLGEEDLYISFLKNDGKWTEPKNLGKTLNTPYKETTPFLASDNRTLYFASTGHKGFGGYDVFMSKRIGEGWDKWTKPVNLGKPVNDAGDDFYFTLAASGEWAYITRSNGPFGKSDIARIKLTQDAKPDPVVLIKGTVYDAKTKKPIQANITYELLDNQTIVGLASSDPNTGAYKIILPYGKHYGFSAAAEGHLSLHQNLDITEGKDYSEIEVDLYLTPIEEGVSITLNNVFFEKGTAKLLPKSYGELNKIYSILIQNKNLEIEIAGHTDGVGSPTALQKLSQARASAITDYLVSKGIQQNRLQAVGYGGNNPIAPNDTEENKQKNRRVEFKVLKK